MGIVAGLWLGLYLVGNAVPGGDPMLKPGVYVFVILVATTAFTVLVAASLALLADRRSLRRRPRA